jgi:hypothetical protein
LRISRHSGLGQKHRVAFAAQQTSSPGVCRTKGQQRWAGWQHGLQQGQVERITRKTQGTPPPAAVVMKGRVDGQSNRGDWMVRPFRLQFAQRS